MLAIEWVSVILFLLKAKDALHFFSVSLIIIIAVIFLSIIWLESGITYSTFRLDSDINVLLLLDGLGCQKKQQEHMGNHVRGRIAWKSSTHEF